MRTGKTVGTLFAFMHAVHNCPDSDIWMMGHTSSTIFDNAIRLILEARNKPNNPLSVFTPFCTWFTGNRELHYRDKCIGTIGAKDNGAVGAIMGKTFSLVYCDEMTFYPDSVIDAINSRLSNEHSKGFASMNPSYPTHKLKMWIDMGLMGDKNYYSQHYMITDNPHLPTSYIEMIRKSLSGVFYKRNFLGQWCLAEGAIFDFFDKNVHVIKRPEFCAQYFIAGIDYGAVNPFACVLIGVCTAIAGHPVKKMYVAKEYYWDPKTRGKQKTNSEFAQDVYAFLNPYGVKSIYLDPSAEAFQLELRKMGLHVAKTNNSVDDGIQITTSLMKCGDLYIQEDCTNLIREIEGYVWDNKAAEKGWDEPIKKNDHAIDALRYAVATHKIASFDLNEYYRLKEQDMKINSWNNTGFR